MDDPRWCGVQASNLWPISVGVVRFHLSSVSLNLLCFLPVSFASQFCQSVLRQGLGLGIKMMADVKNPYYGIFAQTIYYSKVFVPNVKNMRSICNNMSTSHYTDSKAAQTILAPLGSLVLLWAPPKHEEIRTVRRYLLIIVQEDVIKQLCHSL